MLHRYVLHIPSLKLTASLPLKINGWKMKFLLGPGLFSEAFAVSFRECMPFTPASTASIVSEELPPPPTKFQSIPEPELAPPEDDDDMVDVDLSVTPQTTPGGTPIPIPVAVPMVPPLKASPPKQGLKLSPIVKASPFDTASIKAPENTIATATPVVPALPLPLVDNTTAPEEPPAVLPAVPVATSAKDEGAKIASNYLSCARES